MKRILFSPIGSTDPISRQYDGAMLHIIRKYRPEKVYVYMSKEMCELEDKDHRYSWCLDQLRKKLEVDYEVEYIRREELTEVHLFDYFLTEFRDILTRIYDPEAEMLLNVSSGTPAMKSALQILSVMYDKPMKPMQVYTPDKRLNVREDVKGGYDVESEWELDIDNLEGYEDRCTESSVVNMNVEIKTNIIKRMIESYNYVAAYQIAEPISEYLDKRALLLIEAGNARLDLDKRTCSKLCDDAGYDIYPVKQSDQWWIFEFFMLMKIKLAKEEYADFIRSLQALFFTVMERIIIRSGEIDLDKYTYWGKEKNKKYKIKRWKNDEIVKNPLLSHINTNNYKGAIVDDRAYAELISKLSVSSEIRKLVEDIREIEMAIRNPATHSIIQVTDEVIKASTGLNGKDVLKLFEKLIKLSGIKITDENMNRYDALNDEIKRYL